MGKPRRKARVKAPPTREAMVAQITYYAILIVAGLVACVSFTAGASLDGIFLRVIVAILVSVVIGYALNIVLWLASRNNPPVAEEASSPVEAEPKPPTRVDLVAGDDPVPTATDKKSARQA